MTNPGEPRTWFELLFLSFTTLSGVGLGAQNFSAMRYNRIAVATYSESPTSAGAV